MGSDATEATPSLEEVRWRLDAIDGELLKLLDERAGLAGAVAAAKRASGDTGFGLRPGREAQIVRKLLSTPRKGAGAALVIRIWREIMADNLARQGPYQLGVFGGLKLFSLSGFFQADDPRLARAPGQLTGVIGAAPEQFDV